MVVSPQNGGLTVRIAAAPFNDRFTRTIGSSLNPQNVTSVLGQADVGYLWAYADLLSEVRERDAHLHSVLQKREQQIAGAEWELQPPEGSGKRGQKIADWCTARLNEIEAADDLGRSFPDALSDLQGGVYHGRAVMEVVWETQGKYWIPSRLEFVHPRRLAYVTGWKLHLWDASGTAPDMFQPASGGNGPFGTFPGLPLDAFPAGKFLVHRPRVNGNYPTREGLGRTLVWYALFKRFAIRDWLAFAEWAGRGLRIGKYASGQNGEMRASQEDVAALQDALDAVSSAVSTVIPDTTELELHGTPKNNDVHERLTLLCNTETSKAVLGETLTSEVGENGGNRALGEVHNEMRLLVAKSDARSVGATLRRDLFRPMVERSFGKGAPVPSIAFAIEPKDDLDALTDRIVKLSKAGVDIGQVWTRNTLGIPDPEKDEPLVGEGAEPEPTELPPGALGAAVAPADQPDGSKPDGKDKASGEAANASKPDEGA